MNSTKEECAVQTGAMPLNHYQMKVLFCIFAAQLIGSFSNIFCIMVVTKMKNFQIILRPKILMANVVFSDTILTFNSLIPRFLIMKQLMTSATEPTIAAHLLQSLHNYLDNITLYATSFTFTIIACDRYFAISKVFNNPFDKFSTKTLLCTVWSLSLVLSIPFLITNDVHYFDFSDSTLYCVDDRRYLCRISSNNSFHRSVRIFTIVMDFFVPTLLVTWFSFRIIYKLFDDYRKSLKGIRTYTPDLQRCEVTKRLISVLLIFIIKNSGYYLAIVMEDYSQSCGLTPLLLLLLCDFPYD